MFTNYEVWIVDGNSNDGTLSFLEQLKSPFYWVSEEDDGIYNAMNKGISYAKGEWIYFLGADDKIFDSSVLQSVFSKKIPNSTLLIAGDILYNKNSKPFIYSHKKKIKKASWSFLMWIRNGLHHQGTFYRKELFQKEKYSLEYKTLSDYAFNIKLYKSKTHCYLINFLIAKCNGTGISKSGKWEIYKEEIDLKINQSHFLLGPFYFGISVVKYLTRKLVHS